MATTKKPKKSPKPPRGRSASTALISQPSAEDTSSLFALSSFSSRGELFAYVSLAVDKHRLRVYNTTTGQAIAGHIIDTARVSSIIWSPLDLGEADDDEDSQHKKKKRRKRDSLVASGIRNSATEVIALGLSDGSILCFSPSHGQVLRTLSHPSSTSAVLALAAEEGLWGSFIWASGKDATLRLWNLNTNEIVGSWKNDDGIPYASMTIRFSYEGNRTELLSASHSIRLLSSSRETGSHLPKKLSQLATFTGHASPVKSMKWDFSRPIPTRFISMAEADRFLYVWDVPDPSGINGRATASIPLDSDARSFSLSNSLESSKVTVLLTLSASGKIALYPIPQQITSPSSSSPSPAKLPTLQSRSTIVSVSKKSSIPASIINASFVGEEGKICVARLVQGVRPVFTITRYLDETGQFIANSQLEDIPRISPEDMQSLIPNKRYNESFTAVGSGVELGHDENMDEGTGRDIDGDLEVDLAELSLGQRLAVVTDAGVHRPSESEDEGINPTRPQSPTKKSRSEPDIVPANSLTRTLIQALHSSDAKLIETCLAHSKIDLIRNTVKRLPSQLVVPLLNACVERLGRGARAANMKGGGGGASAQRGMTLITWIRTVLTVHTGHLLTFPDLVARLSSLHATLTARLALQESLLSLSGRLDMVLSQIEMRSSAAPALLTPKNGKYSLAVQETPVKHYIEGESDTSDDENAQVDVEIEVGDDEGYVENVELGGDTEDENENEGDDSEVNDESEGSDINEFIDDEAEEYSDEDDESE